ncbi:MAG: sigma-70 family RNA polymerase sigma factor [Arachidicoccus sp.]|nr:sigma-70 family RNA polymerase sigma factor [Arachidicoccus sp.]
MNNDVAEDISFLELIASGNKEAFEQLFHAHWPQVYGTSLRLTKCHNTALDLSQEIFIKVWENRNTLINVKNIKAYLYTLSRNYIIDFLRKKVFNEENIESLIQYFVDNNENAQCRLEFKELEKSFENAIDSLKGKMKQVFILSRKEGLTHDQIANKLGISATSSKTYIVRALNIIRQFVEASPENITLTLAAFAIIHKLGK